MKNAQFTGCPSVGDVPASYGITDYGYNMAYIGGYGPGPGTSRFTGSPIYSKMTETPTPLAKLTTPTQTLLFADSALVGTTGSVSRWPWL